MEAEADDIVIAGAARTPMGGFLGTLESIAATHLGAVAIGGALAQAGLCVTEVDEVLMGNVLAAGLGQAPARQAALGAGIGESVPCTTISKVCGSGMKAVMTACDQIRAGAGEVIVAGGMESMSRAPHLLDKARAGLRLGHGQVKDHMFVDGLEDAYTGRAMGEFAQETADVQGITREEMDAFALASLARATYAIDKGCFREEIAPVTVGKGDRARLVSVDEQPGAARPDKIPHLRPAFSARGTITAANSSSISDGAAALVVTTASKARALGLNSLARVAGYTSHAQAPGLFTTAPIAGIEKLMQKTGWTVAEVDLFEINEAFAMVTMMAIGELGLDHAKVNIHGGACALGHPLGASGARIIVTLLHALRRQAKTRGIASLCIGGGEATSIALETL